MERSGASNKLGQQGENLAAEFLVTKGYKIVDRNVTNRLGEIDILARDGETLVAVEVKTLRISQHYNPVQAIDYKKQAKLRLLAESLAALHPDTNIRIDAVGVYWVAGSTKPMITHLEDIAS